MSDRRCINCCSQLLTHLVLKVAETKSNSDSSRSHCVFTIHFYHKVKGKLKVRSKVSIVDLAGSERSAKTGAKGLRIQEASKINGSLMNLMRCLETLRWNQQHPPNLQKMVPFRESKLTRVRLNEFRCAVGLLAR